MLFWALLTILAQTISVNGQLVWSFETTPILGITVSQTAPDVLTVSGTTSCTVKARPSIGTTGACWNVHFLRVGAGIAVTAGGFRYDIPPEAQAGRQVYMVNGVPFYYVSTAEIVEVTGQCSMIEPQDMVTSNQWIDDVTPAPDIVIPKVQLPVEYKDVIDTWVLGCGLVQPDVPTPATFTGRLR